MRRERCGQRQPLVSMHFCGGKSAALFRVEFTADTLSDGTPCVVARDPDQPEYYGFGADDEEAFQRLLRLRSNGRQKAEPASALEELVDPASSEATVQKEIARRARIEAYREAAEYLEEQMHVPTVAASHLLRQRADELEAGGPPA